MAVEQGFQERRLPQVERFAPETRKALEAQGALIYPLTGLSIRDLRVTGKPFWSSWHEGHAFETFPSRWSEVAINPSQLFLEGSNTKPMDEQLAMLEQYDRDVARRIPGVQAILGSAAVYAQLAFDHLDTTGQYLFGALNNYDCTRTVTPTTDPFNATVGAFFPNSGLVISRYIRYRSYGDCWVAPLIVPAQKQVPAFSSLIDQESRLIEK